MSAKELPSTIEHTSSGTSIIDSSKIAVRWCAGASGDARAALLERAALSLASSEGERPGPAINNTDGLWWVHGAGDAASFAAAIDLLESSDIVEWASPAYRSTVASPAASAAGPPPPTSRQRTSPSTRRASSCARTRSTCSAAPTRSATSRSTSSARRGSRVSWRCGCSGPARSPAARRCMPRSGSPRRCARDRQPARTAPCASRTSRTARRRAAGCRPPAGEFIPNDPMFATSGACSASRRRARGRSSAATPSITVAVIDEGVELGHPDLDVHPQSWNASTDTPDGSPTGNHGTACAGIVARGSTTGRAAGVAGGVRVMAIATATWADIDIAEGLYFAADNGARVVSMSFGVYPSWNCGTSTSFATRCSTRRTRAWCWWRPRGNEDWSRARFPGSDARTLCVGGSNRSDERKRIGDTSASRGGARATVPTSTSSRRASRSRRPTGSEATATTAGDYFDTLQRHVVGDAACRRARGADLSLRPSLSQRRRARHHREHVRQDLAEPLRLRQRRGQAERDLARGGRLRAGQRRAGVARGLRGRRRRSRRRLPRLRRGLLRQTPEECRGPAPLPWLADDRCMFFYEARVFDAEPVDDRRRLQLRVTYQHCLRLLGRQQGALLYTTTLLPGETVQLYEYDRYRRVRSETERMSVHSSFRQTVSALSQTRRLGSALGVPRDADRSPRLARTPPCRPAAAWPASSARRPSRASSRSRTRRRSPAALGAHRVRAVLAERGHVGAVDRGRASVVVSRFEDAEHQRRRAACCTTPTSATR